MKRSRQTGGLVDRLVDRLVGREADRQSTVANKEKFRKKKLRKKKKQHQRTTDVGGRGAGSGRANDAVVLPGTPEREL